MDGTARGSEEAMAAGMGEAAGRVEGVMRGKFRPVVIWPDARLARACSPAKEVDDAVRALLDDLVATLVACGAAGLSAPQVGADLRAVVLAVTQTIHLPTCVQFNREAPPVGLEVACSCGAKPTRSHVCLVNPEVSYRSDEAQMTSEGCLSLPYLHLFVERPEVVRVRALGYDGRLMEVGGDGQLAVTLLHEIDHLDGVTLADRLSLVRRDVLRRKLTKLKARGLCYRSPAAFAEAR